MNYNVDERYNSVVITLKGNVMGGPDGSKLHDTLHELKEGGKTNVVVDLSKVKFMNSSGLGMLISAMTTMRNVRLRCNSFFLTCREIWNLIGSYLRFPAALSRNSRTTGEATKTEE